MTPRPIATRSRGFGHGPVTRLMSPGDLGQMLKPFVFLDLFEIEPATPARFGMHPHSGIATLTALAAGGMQYSDRHGLPSSLAEGGIEWMMAGGGVWHGSPLRSPAAARGFQLWVALPPGLENAAPVEVFLAPTEVPMVGPARVLLGSHQGVSNAVAAPSPLTYLHVTLAAGERWRYVPPAGHDIAWLALDAGSITCPAPADAGELVIFAEGEAALDVAAMASGASFVFGSARKHPHELVTGHYSVHTTAPALAAGEQRIAELGAELRRVGRL